jgi:hypothetical protein
MLTLELELITSYNLFVLTIAGMNPIFPNHSIFFAQIPWIVHRNQIQLSSFGGDGYLRKRTARNERIFHIRHPIGDDFY